MGHKGGDDFFRSRPCDRCKSEEALKIHTMSWFNNDRICIPCSKKEDEIKKKLCEKHGSDASRKFEGCGYIPQV